MSKCCGYKLESGRCCKNKTKEGKQKNMEIDFGM